MHVAPVNSQMSRSTRPVGFKCFLSLIGFVVVLGILHWKCQLNVGFSTPGSKRNNTSDDAPRRRARLSRFHTSAAGQSVTDYNFTRQEALLLKEVNHAAERLDWQKIQSLKASSKVPKTPLFTAEMNAALKCAQFKAGISLYERLCDLGLAKEILTFNLAMKLYGKAGKWKRVEQVWQEAKASYRMDATMAAARLVAAADEGTVATAAGILDEMNRVKLRADVGHFTSAIRACAAGEKGAYSAATYLFQTMLNMSLAPGIYLFTALVSTYAGRSTSVFQALRSQMQKLGIKFGIKTDAAFAEAYLKALLGVQTNKRYSTGELAGLMRELSDGRLQEAADMLSELKTAGAELPEFCEITGFALKRLGVKP